MNEPLPASQLQTTPGGYPLVPSKIVVPGDHGVKVVKEVSVRASPLDAYAFWKDWSKVAAVLPATWQCKVLTPVETLLVSVTPTSGTLMWTHALINDEKGELLAFRSNEQAPIPYAGTLRFEQDDESGCRIRIQVEVLHEEKSERIVDLNAVEAGVEEGLLRFKRALEADVRSEESPSA